MHQKGRDVKSLTMQVTTAYSTNESFDLPNLTHISIRGFNLCSAMDSLLTFLAGLFLHQPHLSPPFKAKRVLTSHK